MKRLCGLVVRVAVSCVVAVLVGAPSRAEAACVQAYEHDFVGQKCDSTGIVEYQGTFSSDSAGGTLNGIVRIMGPTSTYQYQITKAGSVAGPLFKGQMNMSEVKSASTGVVATAIDQTGEWPIGNGHKLVGTLMVQCSGSTCQTNDQRVTTR